VNLLLVLILAVSAMAVVPGCKEKGPAEKAGEAVDEAVENVGDAVEDATE
jgi:hypothetical protein